MKTLSLIFFQKDNLSFQSEQNFNYFSKYFQLFLFQREIPKITEQLIAWILIHLDCTKILKKAVVTSLNQNKTSTKEENGFEFVSFQYQF